MDLKKYFCTLVALWAVTIFAQSRTITIGTSDVDAVLIGSRIRFLPDGGCMIAAQTFSTTVNGVNLPPPQFYPFNGAKCTAVFLGAMKAAHLDVGVGDGGTP